MAIRSPTVCRNFRVVRSEVATTMPSMMTKVEAVEVAVSARQPTCSAVSIGAVGSVAYVSAVVAISEILVADVDRATKWRIRSRVATDAVSNLGLDAVVQWYHPFAAFRPSRH